MISHDELTRLLDYDPNTGVFTWAVDKQYNARRGEVAGNKIKRGYWRVTVAGKVYPAHRLAWFYSYREWPPHEIDHIDRDRTNNRLSNLRLATRIENAGNMWREKQNTSGYKGVVWHKGGKKWMASVKHRGNQIYLGLFENKEDARYAYTMKVRELFGEFA